MEQQPTTTATTKLHSQQTSSCFDRASNTFTNQLINTSSFQQRVNTLAGDYKYTPQTLKEEVERNDLMKTKNTNNNNNEPPTASTALIQIQQKQQQHHAAVRREREDKNLISQVASNALSESSSNQQSENNNITSGIDAEEMRRKALILRTKNKSSESSEQQNDNNNNPFANGKWKMFRARAVGQSTGQVSSLCVDPGNQWFASGSSDGAIRAWNLVSGDLKVTFGTRHIGMVRGIAISQVSPYLFSCGEDRTIKCWDLERNEVVRDYHGHRQAVYTVATHPRLENIVISGGRDKTVRIWDVRERKEIHILEGSSAHSQSVRCVCTQDSNPQLVTAGDDGLVFFWDIGTGRPITCLTRHKKAVRSVCLHPTESTLGTAGADGVRKWRMPVGEYMGAMSGSSWLPSNTGDDPLTSSAAAASSAASLQLDTVWSAGAYSPMYDCYCLGSDDGKMIFGDWNTWRVMYEGKSKAPPSNQTSSGGSDHLSVGILSMSFDRSGNVLLTGERNTLIKFWKFEEKQQQTSSSS